MALEVVLSGEGYRTLFFGIAGLAGMVVDVGNVKGDSILEQEVKESR